MYEDDVDRQIADAAETLEILGAAITGNADLPFELRIGEKPGPVAGRKHHFLISCPPGHVSYRPPRTPAA